jgi:hypothetical protein
MVARQAPSLAPDHGPFGATKIVIVLASRVARRRRGFRYRGHDTPLPHRDFILGRKRGVFDRIKCVLRRRSAIEAVIGHMKADCHLGRSYLKGPAGDAVDVVLSTSAATFVSSSLRALLPPLLAALSRFLLIQKAAHWAS